MISVDRQSPSPLYRQVYDSVRNEILDGAWKPGEKIPSVRDVVGQLRIARNTVANAYQQLCAEGYIESRQGAGYFVADTSFDLLRTRRDQGHDLEDCEEEAPLAANAWKYDFAYGAMRAGSFPVNTWRKLASEVLYSDCRIEMASYGEHRGVWALRQELARYLNRSRDVRCRPEQIILTSGVQQSVNRLLLLFDPASDLFAMEDPGFPPVRMVVQDARFPLCPVPCDEGPQAYLDALERCKPKLIYATPSHQMPMGSHQSLDMRLKLLELAMREDAYIIEDDYDSIFRFDSLPIPTLKSLDTADRVIYLGTFSKILSPALRLGYLVLPSHLLKRYRGRFERYRCGIPWLEQETLRLFMERGCWARHVRRVEHDVRARHALLIKELKRQMPRKVDLLGSEAGLHLLLRVRNGMDQEELVAAAARNEVRICPTRAYWNDPQQSPNDLVMLGYSSIEKDAIEEGVHRLKEAWF